MARSRAAGGDDYLEVSMNTFRFAFLTRKGVHHLMPTFPKMDFHCAITLEGRDDSELPEQALLAVRISGLACAEMASTELPPAPAPAVEVS